MSLELLNDDKDISELESLVNDLLSSASSIGDHKMRPSDARRGVEQYLEEKRLREQIEGALV